MNVNCTGGIFHGNHFSNTNSDDDWYQIDETTKSQIWHPVLTFENTLNIEKQKVLGESLENQFWMKYPNMMHFNEIIKI